MRLFDLFFPQVCKSDMSKYGISRSILESPLEFEITSRLYYSDACLVSSSIIAYRSFIHSFIHLLNIHLSTVKYCKLVFRLTLGPGIIIP